MPIWAKTPISILKFLLGAAKIGAVMTPVNWRLAGPEVTYIVNDCQAKILFIGPEFVDLVKQIKPQFEHVETIFCSEQADRRISRLSSLA